MTMLQRAAILTVARGHTAAATLQITLSTLSRMYVDADMPGSCLQKLEKFYKNTLNSDVLFKIFNIFSTLIQIWPYSQQRPRMYFVLRELIAIHILPSMPLLISKSEIFTRVLSQDLYILARLHSEITPGLLNSGAPANIVSATSSTCSADGVITGHGTYLRSTQPCIPPGSLNRVPVSAGVRAGMSPLPGGR